MQKGPFKNIILLDYINFWCIYMYIDLMLQLVKMELFGFFGWGFYDSIANFTKGSIVFVYNNTPEFICWLYFIF